MLSRGPRRGQGGPGVGLARSSLLSARRLWTPRATPYPEDTLRSPPWWAPTCTPRAHPGPPRCPRRGAQGAAAGGREPRRRGRQCPPSTLRVVGPGRGPGGPWWCPFRGASAPLRPPGVAGSSGAGVAVQTAWEPAAQPLLSSCTVVPSRRTSFCPSGSLWGVPPRFRSFLFSPPLCALRGRHSHGRSLGSPRPRSARAGGPSPDVRSRAHAAVCAGGRFSRALICRA